MASWSTETYLEMTWSNSRCRAGRKSLLPESSPRSWAMRTDSRFLAMEAVVFFFFSPKSRERKDMSLPSEQALHQARFVIVHKAHWALLPKKTRHHVKIGFTHVGALEVDGRGALVGGVQYGFRFWNHAQQGYAQQFLHVGVGQHFPLFSAFGRIAGDQ